MGVTYTLIKSVTVGSGGVANIEFTSIPQTYTDLLAVFSVRDTTSAVSVVSTLTVNAIANDYSFRRLRGSGSAADSYGESAQAAINLYNTSVGASATASTFSNYEIYIPRYAGSTNKSFSITSVTENNATEAFQVMFAGLLSNTAAITSLKVTATALFAQYSSASLYGIKNS
jgi:hypothetical protein